MGSSAPYNFRTRRQVYALATGAKSRQPAKVRVGSRDIEICWDFGLGFGCFWHGHELHIPFTSRVEAVLKGRPERQGVYRAGARCAARAPSGALQPALLLHAVATTA